MTYIWKIVRFSDKLPFLYLSDICIQFSFLAISIIYFPFWYVFSKLPFHIFYSQLSRISLTRMFLLHSSGMHIKHTHNLFSTTTTNSCCEQIILSNSTCVGEIYIINIFICINFLWICKIDFRFSAIQTHCYEPFSITSDVYWHFFGHAKIQKK